MIKQYLEDDDIDPEDLEKQEITKDNFTAKLALYVNKLETLEKLNPMYSHNKSVIANLSQFIKRNKKLLHLNLDSTQLSEFMLFMLCKCLTRAQSCISFHVSGNPGITAELREILWRRVRC